MTPSELKKMDKLQKELGRWKVTALNIMDRYSDLLTAAGVTGHEFFMYNAKNVHERAVRHLESITGKGAIPLLDLSKGDKPSEPFQR